MNDPIKRKNEKELWISFKKGDKEAITTIYENYYPRLYKYGIKLSLDPELTKDCIHEMFCSLWEKRADLCDVAYVNSYLHEYLRRSLYTQLKRKNTKEYSPAQSDFQTDLIFSFEEELIQNESLREDQKKLRVAMLKLTNRQRQILELKYYDGLDYEEIVKLTSLKYKSIRNIMHEAMKALKQSMAVIIFFLFN
ncbi:sigma-70 family RNA polymerase sigma factor [Fulvivirgaceae bacterium BMA10]|uniref:Sigma-70 family RNA polymerase sigma factor n=1 Tax=Splendidivirga corallicola TaxID=3051826 RepID=A0ABT8KNB4_9BACT|nr:sigma-70 family RNA polymerase sigma factor [Fulvivirgaceae bacterium BMA10]